MKTKALLVALSLAAIACDSGSSDDQQGGLGSVSLNDSTDTSGKADALQGRTVQPRLTEIVAYGPDSKNGTTEVTDLTDAAMSVQAPLITLDAFEESLQITASGDETTDIRFFLAYQEPGDSSWYLVIVEGQGEFEDGDEPADGMAQPTPVTISYFDTVSILKSTNTISVASTGAGGQTTTELPFDGRNVEYAVLALPVDSGEGNSLVGRFGYTIEAQCDGFECGEEPIDPDVPVDDYAQARDVTLEAVTIGGDALAYEYPSVDSGFNLAGTEFWQKWPGGHNPTYSYNEGTEAGRKCMLASAIRFEAIMADPPPSMVELRDNTNWGGRFFNWNDDFSEGSSSARGAVLWAWRTGLIKWISQTDHDGTCYLPTLDIVERAAASCLARGEGDGEIQGCQG